VQLLGVLDDGERLAWETIAGRGLVDAAELASAAGCSLADATRLLDALYRRRLVMRLDGGYVVLGGVQ
jgi:DNA-binding IclR family transcriptional regulator